MTTFHRFIAAPGEPVEILSWFHNLPSPPRLTKTEFGTALFFEEFGPLHRGADGKVDWKKSPVVTIFSPTVKRGVLWTVGEVRFLPTPLKSLFPPLYNVSRALSRWLSGFECVFSMKRKDNRYDYYLEGSVRNYDPPVYAFESGLEALRTGQYFIDVNDTDFRIDTICQYLKLRGVVPTDT